MKKAGAVFLLIAACIFLSALVGFFIGRNASPSPIEISMLSRSDAIAKPAASPSTASPEASTDPVETTPPGLVNINTATLAQLQTLPGVGPTLAQRIVDYREENGPFTTLSELTMVEGIGLSKLEAILDYATVGGEE